MPFDLAWRDAVVRACSPVFDGADAGFLLNDSILFEADSPTLLWEADPTRFAARFPEAGIEESYGGPTAYASVHCIDFWVYVDPATRTARLSTEGWSGQDPTLPLSGDGASDAALLADAFARRLRGDGNG